MQVCMTTTVQITARYKADPDLVFQSALCFSEMAEAMSGIASYEGFPDDDTANEGDTIVVDITFWGLFTIRGHKMFIERLDRNARVIQSREHSDGIRRWDHNLTVQPDDNLARWTDTVVIDAGWRTGIVARFAAFIYMRRHRRRQALTVACEFFQS